MSTRWFGPPPGGRRLEGSLPRLIAEVARLLDRLETAAVAPGSGRVDPEAAAVVLPHSAIPGCALVVQVAEWSSSVGCWWAVGTDPLAGPVAPELSVELPLRPDGLDRAVAWLEAELTRPVVERERGYGVARRRQWSLVLDDGGELPVGVRWQPAWDLAGDEPASAAGTRPEAAGWLLGAGAAAALAHWGLAALTGEPLGASWLGWAVRALELAAFAALLAWFGLAGAGAPDRVRARMLAGLLLATLGAGLALLPGPARSPSATDPVLPSLWALLRESSTTLLAVAALACYLAAVLGMPGRPTPDRPGPRALPVLAGLGWGIDLAVGLLWRVAVDPADRALLPPVWYDVLGSVLRAAAVGLAILLVLAVLERRPAMTRRAARAGLAGAVLLVLAWSVALQLATGLLAMVLPFRLVLAIFGAPALAEFAGTALLAIAVAAPAPQPAATDGSPSPRVATEAATDELAAGP